MVEPQRTNLVLYSEQFDNASWSLGLSATIAANTSISPDGTQNADTLTLINAATSRIQQTITATSSTYTISIYAKSNVSKKFRFRIITSGTSQISNDFTTSNVWQRYSFTFTSDIVRIEIINDSLAVAGSLDIWGAQLEAGANATSYIPTTTASVTRNADVISKTSATDLIGQTEGTLYAEVNFTASNLSDRTIVNLSDNTTANWIFIRTSATVPNGIRFRIANGGSLQFDYNSSAKSTGVHKLCLSYKLNNISVYIDGVKVNSSTTATIPATSKINIGCMHDNTLQFNDRIKSALLFKTQLTDAECIALTTI